MVVKRARFSLLLNTILMLFCSSLGYTSDGGLEDLLPKDLASKKKVFSCPATLKREKLLDLLKAPYKKVASQTGGSIQDQVAEPKEIEPGLWAAHKMTDTTRLLDLLKQDDQKLIKVLLDSDESRPKGTLGEEFDSIMGTYYFYQKKTPDDPKALKLAGYSLIVAFYQKKPE